MMAVCGHDWSGSLKETSDLPLLITVNLNSKSSPVRPILVPNRMVLTLPYYTEKPKTQLNNSIPNKTTEKL